MSGNFVMLVFVGKTNRITALKGDPKLFPHFYKKVKP